MENRDRVLKGLTPGTCAVGAVVLALAAFSLWYGSTLGHPSTTPSYALGSMRFFELERSALLFLGLLLIASIIGSAFGLILPFKLSFSIAGAQVAVEQVAVASDDLAAKIEDMRKFELALQSKVDDAVKGIGQRQARASRVLATVANRVAQLESSKGAPQTAAKGPGPGTVTTTTTRTETRTDEEPGS